MWHFCDPVSLPLKLIDRGNTTSAQVQGEGTQVRPRGDRWATTAV